MNIDLVPIKSKNVKYFSIVNIGVTIVHLLFRFYTLNHALRFYIFSSHFSFYIFCGLNNVLFNFMICLDLLSETDSARFTNLLHLYDERCKKGWCLLIFDNVHNFVQKQNIILDIRVQLSVNASQQKIFLFCLYNSFKQILHNFFDNTFIANLLDNNISFIFISTKCFIFQNCELFISFSKANSIFLHPNFNPRLQEF